MKIAILGAGFTGLTCAYRLTQANHQVTLFEKESFAGGLASGLKNYGWEWTLERFYHHLFAQDQEAINLINELGLSSKLFFKKPVTAVYCPPTTNDHPPAGGPTTIYPLDSPLALLKFPHLSLTEKLRTGLALAYLKILSNYHSLEQITAEKWLTVTIGEKSYKTLWEPLLTAKFGTYASRVTAAWFWARIKKRTRSLGYLEGGFQTLADHLVNEIKDKGGKIILKNEVQGIEKRDPLFMIHNSLFDIVVSTLPTPVFLKIALFLPQDYRQSLSQIPHLWAQTLILELNKPFLSNTYWLNINDPSFPFLAVVEHTNFVDRKYYANHHIIYVGNYLPNNHPYLKKSAPELLQIFTPYLKKLNPDFDHQSSLINHKLFTVPSAQPVITLGFQPLKLQTPVPKLYLADLDCVYPWDRGVNYAIELGERVARLVMTQ